MSSNLKLTKRPKKSDAKIWRKKPSLSMLTSAGNLRTELRLIQETTSVQLSSAGTFSLFSPSYDAKEILTNWLTGTTTNWAKISILFRLRMTNLNNIPITFDMWSVRPKIDVTGSSASYTVIDMMDINWVAIGGTSFEWALDRFRDTNPSSIPYTNNILKVRYVGSGTLRPQEEKVVMSKNIRQYATRGRAQLLDGINTQQASVISRGEWFLLVKYHRPYVSAATSSGFAPNMTMIHNVTSTERIDIAQKTWALPTSFDGPDAVGVTTVFHRDNVTTGALVSGNTTI